MMTAEQLKASILQMAMQGKLVEQRAEEGTGEELLKTITKKFDTPKSFSINEEEITFEIPESWAWTKVGNVTILYNGRAFKPSDWTEDGLPIVRIQNLNDENAPFNRYNGVFDEEYHLYGEELLFAWSGTPGTSFGAHIWKRQEAVLNQHIFRIEFPEKYINKKYFAYALNFQVLNLIRLAHGSAGLQHVTKGNFQNTLIPLPPLEEQKRIVAKIEELMPFVEQYAKASTRLNSLNASFPDQMKKAILQQAVMGKLVPQDPNDEPASVLLKKIAEEKQKLIKEEKIKKDKNTSLIFREGQSWYELIGGKKICIDEEVPYDIPENWSWVRLNELGDYKKGPFGSALTKSMFVPAGPNSVKVYEQKNAIQKDWTLGEYYIKREYYDDKMSGFTVESGDVIVSCAGTIGETYVMPKDIELGIINQALMRIKIYNPMNVAYFLMYFDYIIKESAREQSKGSAIKNIPPFAVFKRLLFPMPPLAEQDRILEKLKCMDAQISRLKSK